MTTISIYYISLLNFWFGHLQSPWEISSRIKCLIGHFEGFKVRAEFLENLSRKIPLQAARRAAVKAELLWKRLHSPSQTARRAAAKAELLWKSLHSPSSTVRREAVKAEVLLKNTRNPPSYRKGGSQVRTVIKEDQKPPQPPEGRKSRQNFYERILETPSLVARRAAAKAELLWKKTRQTLPNRPKGGSQVRTVMEEYKKVPPCRPKKCFWFFFEYFWFFFRFFEVFENFQYFL